MAENHKKTDKIEGVLNSTAYYLEFEQPIAELESKLSELRRISSGDSSNGNISVDINDEIQNLEKKCTQLKNTVYSNLSPWQISQLARHPHRPYVRDYIKALFTDFEELHGDRQFADDPAIVTGLARFNGNSVAVVGHQKGRDTDEKVRCNFGMPKPEGYRKARRLFEMAERFNLPLLSFIDTPGAYPGVGAEERGQSEAIAVNLKVMSQLKVPIITTITGEGGSGGALAIGVADCLFMLQYSTYSVISPEGCAAILWKDSQKTEVAASILNITSERLIKLGLIDEVISEPLGGAQSDFPLLCSQLKSALSTRLKKLQALDIDKLLEDRYQKIMSVGYFQVKS